MTEGEPLILFLSVEEDRVAEPGPPAGQQSPVIAVAPVAACGLAVVDLPALAPAQAAAAARLQLADRLALEAEPVHLVVAAGDGPRPACWVAERQMRAWQETLSGLGYAPDAIIPAALVVSFPQNGAHRFVLGAETLVAQGKSVWIDDPVLTASLAMTLPEPLDARCVAEALHRAASQPPLNLLSGMFAPRSGWRSERKAVRLLAGLLAGLVLASLLVPVARSWSIHRAADRIEEQARQIARATFPEAVDPLLAVDQAREGAFPARYSALSAAIEASSNSELAGLSFTREGVLEAKVRVGTGAARDAFLDQLSANGLDAHKISETAEQGRLLISLRLDGL